MCSICVRFIENAEQYLSPVDQHYSASPYVIEPTRNCSVCSRIRGLLEAGWFARIQGASDRGVDVYLGTRDPTVRRYIEENAPEVIMWEPNTNWLNMPLAGDRVRRLLLADREAVMLGTLREETADGVHEEQAIIGEGTHDTLVTIISQLIGPHLEQIDEETEDIASKLPL